MPKSKWIQQIGSHNESKRLPCGLDVSKEMELTRDTEKVVDSLFECDEAKTLKDRLKEELSGDLPLTAFSTPESRERVWLAVIKKCNETLNPWDTWFELAKLDWRDILMAADFGHDTTAHIRWKRKVLTS